jgi:DNA-binding CsgD family transcriptional regulator
MGVTSREKDVLLLLGERLSDRQIGERRVLSPRTVEKHVERLELAAKFAYARARNPLCALARMQTPVPTLHFYA